MKNSIKAILAVMMCTCMLFLMTGCSGRIGEDVYDGDEVEENLTDGITSDEEIYGGMNDMLDMSPDSADVTR